MAEIPGSIRVTGFIAPTDSTDTYPVTHDTYNKGGYRTVASIAERNGITSDRRSIGMMVYVDSESKAYVLRGEDVSDNNGWEEFAPGLDLAGNIGDIQLKGANGELDSIGFASSDSAGSSGSVLKVTDDAQGISAGSLLTINANGRIVGTSVNVGDGLSVAGNEGDFQLNAGDNSLGAVVEQASLNLSLKDNDLRELRFDSSFNALFQIKSNQASALFLNADRNNLPNGVGEEYQNATIMLAQDGEAVYGAFALVGDGNSAPSFMPDHADLNNDQEMISAEARTYPYTGTTANNILIHGSHGINMGVGTGAHSGFGEKGIDAEGNAKNKVRVHIPIDGNITLIPEGDNNTVKIEKRDLPANEGALHLGSSNNNGSVHHAPNDQRINVPTDSVAGDLLGRVGGTVRSLTYEGELPVREGEYPFANIVVNSEQKISEIKPNIHRTLKHTIQTMDLQDLSHHSFLVEEALNANNEWNQQYVNPHYSQYNFNLDINHPSVDLLNQYFLAASANGQYPFADAVTYETKPLNAFGSVALPDPEKLIPGTRITITFGMPDLSCLAMANRISQLFPPSSGASAAQPFGITSNMPSGNGAAMIPIWTNNSYLYRKGVCLFITGPKVSTGPRVSQDLIDTEDGNIQLQELLVFPALNGETVGNYRPAHYINGGVADWIMSAIPSSIANAISPQSNEDGRFLYTTGPMLLPGDSMTFTVIEQNAVQGDGLQYSDSSKQKIWQITESHLMAGYQAQFQWQNIDTGIHPQIIPHGFAADNHNH